MFRFCLVHNTTGRIVCTFKHFRTVYEAITYWCPATSIREFDNYSIRYND